VNYENDFNKATNLAMKAHKLALNQDYAEIKNFANACLGDLECIAKRYQNALRYYNMEIETSETPPHYRRQLFAKANMAWCHAQLKEDQKVKTLIEDIESMNPAPELLNLHGRLNELKWLSYQAEGRNDLAYEYFKKALHIFHDQLKDRIRTNKILSDLLDSLLERCEWENSARVYHVLELFSYRYARLDATLEKAKSRIAAEVSQDKMASIRENAGSSFEVDLSYLLNSLSPQS